MTITVSELVRQCQPTIGEIIEDEKRRARYEAVGWCHAFCCAALDDGRDPRKIDCAEIMEKVRAQLETQNCHTGKAASTRNDVSV